MIDSMMHKMYTSEICEETLQFWDKKIIIFQKVNSVNMNKSPRQVQTQNLLFNTSLIV